MLFFLNVDDLLGAPVPNSIACQFSSPSDPNSKEDIESAAPYLFPTFLARSINKYGLFAPMHKNFFVLRNAQI